MSVRVTWLDCSAFALAMLLTFASDLLSLLAAFPSLRVVGFVFSISLPLRSSHCSFCGRALSLSHYLDCFRSLSRFANVHAYLFRFVSFRFIFFFFFFLCSLLQVGVASKDIEAFESALKQRAEAGLVDMDEHLDDVTKDWRNLGSIASC